VRFLIDAMFPPQLVAELNSAGHDSISPVDRGAHSLGDDALIDIATAEQRVIVTENASDFAHVTTCAVLFVRKSWWPQSTLAKRLAAALGRWAAANPHPGPWGHWLDEEFR
jgi:hypothetical protein